MSNPLNFFSVAVDEGDERSAEGFNMVGTGIRFGKLKARNRSHAVGIMA